jgi:signal transduction histidine kinase
VSIASPGGQNPSYDELLVKFNELLEKNRQLEEQLAAPATTSTKDEPVAASITAPAEFVETLTRLLMKIAMIIQAEKALYMTYDRRTDELVAREPAFGIPGEYLADIRLSAKQGLASETFRAGEPRIWKTPNEAPVLAQFGARNGLIVPLDVEHKDDNGRVVEARRVGLLLVFNKRFGGQFVPEDVKLLAMLSRQAAAVLAQARMFEEIIEEKERYEATFESVSVGLLMVQNDGIVSEINASARRIFHLENGSDGAGHPFDAIITDPAALSIMKSALSGEEGMAEITANLGDEGDQRPTIFRMQAAQIHGQDRQPAGAVAVFSDITDVRNAERSKTSFIDAAAHDLRNPMAAIKGFAETLLSDPDEDMFTKEDRQEFLGIIAKSCKRQLGMISDLLNIAKIDAGKALDLHLAPVRVGEIVEDVVRLDQENTSLHTYQVDIDPAAPPVIADEVKVDRMITNLVTNARKYSPDGGEIHISVKYIPDGEKVQVAVADQGLGIPKDQLPRMFGKFSRVKAKGFENIPGTGLGLSMVKNLVELHGGRIWVESEYGKGSTFTFQLPVHGPKTEQ